MLPQQYPVTTPYGLVPGYPLHNGFHQGIDYGCPVGTPVLVNGITIGISGNTGYTFGPHLHLGKWLGGVVQNPLNGGFTFNSAVVTEINEDTDDGKYVRIQGDGFSWVYLHLSDNSKVKVGQVLKGVTMPITDDQKYHLIQGITGRDATLAEITDTKLWADIGFAIDTFWNNGGEVRFKNHSEAQVKAIEATRDEFGKIADARYASLKQVADFVGVDNPDDINAIMAKLQTPAGFKPYAGVQLYVEDK